MILQKQQEALRVVKYEHIIYIILSVLNCLMNHVICGFVVVECIQIFRQQLFLRVVLLLELEQI